MPWLSLNVQSAGVLRRYLLCLISRRYLGGRAALLRPSHLGIFRLERDSFVAAKLYNLAVAENITRTLLQQNRVIILKVVIVYLRRAFGREAGSSAGNNHSSGGSLRVRGSGEIHRTGCYLHRNLRLLSFVRGVVFDD